MTSDEGTVYDDAPLCLCCERALAYRLSESGHILVDPDLRVPVCLDCEYHLHQARTFLADTSHRTGIRGCASLGPDSGQGVRP